jgi:hypothetical protein
MRSKPIGIKRNEEESGPFKDHAVFLDGGVKVRKDDLFFRS